VRARLAISVLVLSTLAAITLGTVGASARSGGQTATPKRGGTLTIARQEDTESLDKTNVFQNESIWLAEQINETLYTVTPNGQNVKPWLATSYKVSHCATACVSRTGRR
jgi:peptide/nickel transport system substrate-binding protein